MRVTNHMVTSSSLRNMQKSMQRVSRLNDQVTSGKKISAPSEDPVVAIRALKLRTTCDQLDQYKNKNIKDALSWLDTTQSSIENILSRMQSVYEYAEQGANDTFSTGDRNKIINELRSLKDGIYSEGGTTYAGRYLFSGYKTETNLIFQNEAAKNGMAYSITEELSPDKIRSKSVVLNEINVDNLDGILEDGDPYTSPTRANAYTLQLAYDKLDKGALNGNDLSIVATDKDGNTITLPTMTVMSVADSADYYNVGAEEIHFIPETGEIVFGDDIYESIKKAQNLTVNYNKSDFAVGDLRPEMYFNCTQYKEEADGSVKTTEYTVTDEGQPIRYEVNFNQYITVNAEGRNIITHDIGNDIDDMATAVQNVLDIESAIQKLKGYLSDPKYMDDEDAVEQINKMLEDADVELAMKREDMQKLFGRNMTNFQNFMNDVSAQQAIVGTNYSKLELIETRVIEQLDNFKELKSSNEDIETEEAALELYQAELVYESALATTSNVVQKTLLDYL
ncbi:MAG: flagellar hook-associated protein FlgL [Lachnospiraceae bacterium]|nr:flagellar hook-associated protein FlgL [Lachnospiraceae bacterium]